MRMMGKFSNKRDFRFFRFGMEHMVFDGDCLMMMMGKYTVSTRRINDCVGIWMYLDFSLI